jgi:hypothetical protein
LAKRDVPGELGTSRRRHDDEYGIDLVFRFFDKA